MTGFLAQLGIREARVLASSAPLGTSGRIHAVRLRRLFQQPEPATSIRGRRQQSTIAEAEAILEKKEATDSDIGGLQDSIRHKLRALHLAPEDSNAGNEELTINGEPLDIAQFTPNSTQKPKHPPLYRPSKLKAAEERYDQFFYDYSHLLRRSPEPDPDAPPPPPTDPVTIAAEVDKILQTGNHHIAIVAIGRLASLPADALSEIQPEQFTALLKLMDPSYFFASHIRFDRSIPTRSPFYIEFFTDATDFHHPRNVFLRLLSKILKARKASGWPLTQEDHKFEISTRRVLGDVDKTPLNVLLHARMRTFPSTIEAFNALLSTLVSGGVWASAAHRHKKQITSRFWPRNDEDVKEEQVNKGRAAYIFQKLTERGIPPNEETMCHMMTIFAREGDMDGVKQIFEATWGVNIYKFLALGEEGIGRDFDHDSPVRPTVRLLETIAHVFGTNQDIPLALRLMDFISRRYNLDIPLAAWEELIERTYTLSTYKKADRSHSTSEEHPRKPLPQTSVYSLWKTMTAPPYNVQPNMPMYDKVIRSLIAKQRFGKAEELMEEGRVVHKSNVKSHRKALKSSAFQIANPGRTTPEKRILADHATWLSNMEMHRSRQFVRGWVKKLIWEADRNEWQKYENGEYMAGVVERWKLFLPKTVEYEVPTGRVKLRHDGLKENKERVQGFRRSWERTLEKERDE